MAEFLSSDSEKLKPSVKEAPKIELKNFHVHLECVFLGENSKLLVMISSTLEATQKEKLLGFLRKHKRVIGWKISDIKGINLSFCTHKIMMEDNIKSKVQPQRRLNPNMMDLVKSEVKKLMDAGVITQF